MVLNNIATESSQLDIHCDIRTRQTSEKFKTHNSKLMPASLAGGTWISITTCSTCWHLRMHSLLRCKIAVAIRHQTRDEIKHWERRATYSARGPSHELQLTHAHREHSWARACTIMLGPTLIKAQHETVVVSAKTAETLPMCCGLWRRSNLQPA